MAVRKPTKISGLYVSGISNPWRADSDGGVAISEADDYVDGLVKALLEPNDSDNPFQQDDFQELPIFQTTADPAWRIRYRRSVEDAFELSLGRFNLARFISLTFNVLGEGEMGATLSYINLETRQQRKIAASIRTIESAPLQVI